MRDGVFWKYYVHHFWPWPNFKINVTIEFNEFLSVDRMGEMNVPDPSFFRVCVYPIWGFSISSGLRPKRHTYGVYTFRRDGNYLYLQTQFGEDRCTQFRVIVITFHRCHRFPQKLVPIAVRRTLESPPFLLWLRLR